MVNHVTKDGDSIPIPAMDDDHLKNTINLFLKKLRQSKEMVNGERSKFDNIAYGAKDKDHEAAKYIERFPIIFSVYFVEAAIRNFDLSPFIKILQDVYGRTGMVDCSGFCMFDEDLDYIEHEG